MTTKQNKCADLIEESMKDREAQIKALLADADGDENEDPALSIDSRKVTIVCLSWGGPADYLEITHKGLDIIQVIYRYSDWFDSATREVYDNSPLYTYAQFILECDASNYENN
jgi:hypothetical protein